jgi:2,5-diamino-6-(ribosylamino)-4(3H)-pyrimidinone 5'-phosphate reductase
MGRPYVMVMSASTVDGRIASSIGYSRLSCPFDLRRLHEVRASVDAVMVGAGTVITDDPSLLPRYAQGKRPIRVIVDGSLRIPTTARVITDAEAPTIVATTERAPEDKLRYLASRVHVWVLGKDRVDLRELLTRLHGIGVRRLLVEGGGRLNWEMIRDDLVDEVRLTITPYIFGSGISFINGEGYPTTRESPALRLISVDRCECGNEIVAQWRIMRVSNDF